jgi:hypothetical protein
MDQEHQITLLLPRARLSPVISTMPEGLHPGVIFYPHTRCGNPCLGKTVALKFLDSHPRESIKTNNGLYPKCPNRGKVGCADAAILSVVLFQSCQKSWL